MKDQLQLERTLVLAGALVSASLALFVLLTLLGGGLPAHAAPSATTRYVAPSASCGSVSPCYSTIQASVDAAGPGDVIKVAQATYTDIHHIANLDTATFTATQIVAITKSVTIQGGYTSTNWTTPNPEAHPTTLDAQSAGRVLVISGNITPTIVGFRITGGNSKGLGGMYWGDVGGAIYIKEASPVISNNQIYSNTATWYGGGLHLLHSAATINKNSIFENSTQHRGGGLYLDNSPATLSNNIIYSNTTSIEGGGVCSYGSEVSLFHNMFRNNMANAWGGGLYLYGSNAVLNGNVISGNAATQGGGLWFKDCTSLDLTDNVVARNSASAAGSGLWFDNNPWYATTGRLRHNTIISNTGVGQGVFLGINTTLAFTNTIIVSHTVGITVTDGSTVTLDTTLWYANTTDWSGNVSSENDYHQNPGLAADGYHLITGSFAIDRGVNAGVATDIDGDRRPQGAGYDLGADEFLIKRIYLPLVLRNH